MMSECTELLPPWSVLVQRTSAGETIRSWSFAQSYVLVGRRPDCDIVLDDPSVAPRQLYLQQLPGRIAAVDLSGDHPLKQLVPDDWINVGEFRLQAATAFAAGDVPLLPSFREPFATWGLSNAKGGTQSLTERNIRHELTLIGRSPTCRFRINHASISPVHASLVVLAGGLYAIDLGSRTGMRVNGESQTFARVREGDELQIGDCRGVIRERSLAQVSLEVPKSACAAVEALEPDFAEDGIVASLSDGKVVVHHERSLRADLPRPPSIPPATLSAGNAEEDLLSMVVHFLKLQQATLEQTQQLVKQVSDRLDHSQDRTPSSTSSDPTEQIAAPEKFQVSTAPQSETSPNAEVHTWLTQQLTNLHGSDADGLSRFWRQLTGAR